MFESEEQYMEALDYGDQTALIQESPEGAALLDEFAQAVASFGVSVNGDQPDQSFDPDFTLDGLW